jgi:hypothetical protein
MPETGVILLPSKEIKIRADGMALGHYPGKAGKANVKG